MDALTEVDTLVEAALLEIALDAVGGEAWFLFDCRGALQIEEANTAVVVVQDVTELRWTTTVRHGPFWHAVMSWEPFAGSDGLTISAGFAPDADLHVVGSGGAFYVGNIPGGDGPPPDLTSAGKEEIRLGLASWSSEIELVGTSYR